MHRVGLDPVKKRESLGVSHIDSHTKIQEMTLSLRNDSRDVHMSHRFRSTVSGEDE